MQKIFYFEWSPPWHFKKYLDKYSKYSDNLSDIYSDIPSGKYSSILSDIRSGNLSGSLCDMYYDILSGILSDIFSDMVPGIHSDILSGILPDTYSDILSGILSDIYSGSLSDIYSGILSGILLGKYSGSLSDIRGILSGILSRILPDILSDTYSDMVSGIFSDILFGILSDIYFGILSDKYAGILSDVYSGILSDLFSDMVSGIYSENLSGILSSILSGILSHILSDIYFEILSGILSDIYCGILLGIYSRSLSETYFDIVSGGISFYLGVYLTYSGILSDIFSGILSGILSGGWGPAVSTGPRLRSSGAHWAREVPGWGGLAVPTGLERSSVEVQQCPLISGDGCWGPAAPTGIGSWRGGEEAEEEEEKTRRAILKSNNVHLCLSQVSSLSLFSSSCGISTGAWRSVRWIPNVSSLVHPNCPIIHNTIDILTAWLLLDYHTCNILQHHHLQRHVQSNCYCTAVCRSESLPTLLSKGLGEVMKAWARMSQLNQWASARRIAMFIMFFLPAAFNKYAAKHVNVQTNPKKSSLLPPTSAVHPTTIHIL